jgi:uncharacterized membrane protein HdeD (DUF308 family)
LSGASVLESRLEFVNSWYAPLARAIPAIAVAIVITFTADHSEPLGFITFGLFATLAGAMITVFSFRSPPGVARTLQLAQGLITLVAGIVSLATSSGGLPFFVFLLSAFAVLTGAIELYLGLRERKRERVARDWVFVGALTLLLAVIVLLVPPDFVQTFTGPDGIQRALTASVIVVGVLGAYWAILGIYLVIAALSLKWAPDAAHETIEA